MTGHDYASTPGSINWDPVALELQALRESAGDLSYGDIAARVSQQRESSGLTAFESRLARTTVYDCFRSGRSRLDLSLVREIAQALGAGDGQVDAWIARCRNPDIASAPAHVEKPTPSGPRPEHVVLVLVACVALNLVGRLAVDLLHLPMYLDMVGTAIAALALGPWLGALVGGTTNLLGVLTSGWVSAPFALVNIAGALVWGYGVRRWGLGRDLPRFFLLNVLVAVVCTLVSVPLLMVLFEGSVGAGQDTITQTFFDLGHVLVVAVGFSNMLTSLVDKLISGFLALVVISALPAAMRVATRLTLVSSADHARAESGR